jgi:hypothetical protein
MFSKHLVPHDHVLLLQIKKSLASPIPKPGFIQSFFFSLIKDEFHCPLNTPT